MPALAVIPACLRTAGEAALLTRCLASLRRTAPGTPAIVIDASPAGAGFATQAARACDGLGFERLALPDARTFARAANAGLAIAEDAGIDAVVIHADVELVAPGWLEALDASPADIAGARLLFPDGTLQHCGYLYSRLQGRFEPRMLFGPADLPASLEPAVCPVGSALTLIRHEALVALGGFDEGYALGGEDVDLCLRAFAAGGMCGYVPDAVAVHHHLAWMGVPDGERDALRAASAQRLAAAHDETAVRPFAPAAA